MKNVYTEKMEDPNIYYIANQYREDIKWGRALSSNTDTYIDTSKALYKCGHYVNHRRSNSCDSIIPYVHTPFTLIEKQFDVIRMLGNEDISGDVLIFNIEYYAFLKHVNVFDMSKINIHLYTDDRQLYQDYNGRPDLNICYDPNPDHDLMRCMYNVERLTFDDGRKNDKIVYNPKMKFDYVIGNPPYEQAGTNQGGSSNLWSKFVKKASELTKEGGFISMIHPGSWKSYATQGRESLLRDFYLKYKLHYLDVGTASDQFHGVTSTFDWWVVQKEESNGIDTYLTTKHNGSVVSDTYNFSNMNFIPEKINPVSLKVSYILSNEPSKLNIEKSCELHTQSNDLKDSRSLSHKYPLKHTVSGDRWSSKKHLIQDKEKIILYESGYLRPEYDSGNYGVTQSALYIIVDDKEEAEYILSLLNSNLYTYFRRVNKWSGFHHLYLLNEMPYIKGLDIDNIDNELYEHFNLSDGEIDEIESFLN